METLVLEPEKSRTSATARILIADDQPDVVEALRLLLKGEGYEAEGVSSPAAVLQAIASGDFDLLLLDLNYTRDTTSGVEGLDLLSRIKASGSILPVVVMTAWGSVELAVEAMHRGVGDFVLKPWNNRQLLEILRTQIEQGASRRRQLQDEERELEDVEAVQRGFLPKEIPQLAGYEISGAWLPARGVGGDYFDIHAFSETKLCISIADVSGKGMSAALLMSNLQAALKATASEQLPPEQLCGKSIGSFATMFRRTNSLRLFTACLTARATGWSLRMRATMRRFWRGKMVLGCALTKAACRWDYSRIGTTKGARFSSPPVTGSCYSRME